MEYSERSSSFGNKTVNIVGDILSHWVKIGTDEGLATDTQIATFLIRHYFTSPSRLGTELSVQCDHCHEPLTLVCARCGHPSHTYSTSETKDFDVPVITKAQQKAFTTPEDKMQSPAPVPDSENEPQFAHSEDGQDFDHIEDKETLRASLDIPSEMNDSHSNPERFQVQHRELTQASTEGNSTGKFSSIKSSRPKEEDPDYALPVAFGKSQHGVDSKNVQIKTEAVVEAPIFEENRHEQDGIQPASSYSDQTIEQAACSASYKLRNTDRSQSADQPHSCSKCDATFRMRHHLKCHLQKVHAVTDFFPCKFCHKMFSTFSSLKQHQKTHKGLTMHIRCDPSFQQAYQLRLHTQTRTGEKPFVCSVCSSAFSKKYKLTYHMRRHTGEKPFSCEECGSTFTQSQYLVQHMRIHTGEKPYVCTECGAAFNQHTAMKIHLGTHSAEKPYACNVCEKAYKNPFSLNKHTKVHHNSKDKQQDPVHNQEEPSVCEECGKTFRHSCNLKRHMKAHSHKEEPSVCQECGKTFRHSHNLKKHMKVHENKKERSVCQDCGRTFSNSSSLERHVKSHEHVQEEGPFVCKECGKEFRKADFLQRHSHVHSEEKPFMCTVCGTSFRHASKLTSHMRTHSDERPYKCSHENCKAAFKRRNALRHHERIHTQYKPNVCQFCSAAFIQSSNLKKHLRMHTDERPYVCEICGKSFRQSSQLKNHNLMHRDERPHICKVCGAAFRRDYTLKFHLQKKHADLDTSAKPKQACGLGHIS